VRSGVWPGGACLPKCLACGRAAFGRSEGFVVRIWLALGSWRHARALPGARSMPEMPLRSPSSSSLRATDASVSRASPSRAQADRGSRVLPRRAGSHGSVFGHGKSWAIKRRGEGFPQVQKCDFPELRFYAGNSRSSISRQPFSHPHRALRFDPLVKRFGHIDCEPLHGLSQGREFWLGLR
jgi:hypothetical protein